MQRYEIDAWLGDDHGLSEDQITALVATAATIRIQYQGPDQAGERETALTVAYRLMVEDPQVVVAELAEQLQAAHRARARATVGLKQAISVVKAGGKGARGITTTAGFAATAGVDRKTVLNWLQDVSID